MWDNHAVAVGTLEEELGYYGEKPLPYYEMDEAVRHRLIAHTRQDVAHALCNTHSLWKRLLFIEFILILNCAMLAYLIFR